jgi:CheY-like chemotaxis protein
MERTAVRFRANVKVVMADGDTYMCQGLRNALTNEGYRDVRTVGRLSALRDVLAAAMADLLVLDAHLADGDAIALVREIRNGKTARNPFLPIILLTWTTDPEVVQRAVSSGVDLILAKPLSPAQLFSRIDGLVADRKPFVVTADYIGPDRRGGDKPGDVQRYDVPNTLKEKMEGRPIDPVALSEQIDAALEEMNGSRLAQAGVKLAGMVDGICRAFEAGRISDETAIELAQVGYMAKSIANLGGADLGKLCKSLIKIVRTMHSDLDAIDDKQIELLRPLSHSILLAANPKLALHPMMDEITRAVSAFVPKTRSEAEDDEEPVAV